MEYDKMTIANLKNECKKLGLPTNMKKKSEFIAALMDHNKEEEKEDVVEDDEEEKKEEVKVEVKEENEAINSLNYANLTEEEKLEMRKRRFGVTKTDSNKSYETKKQTKAALSNEDNERIKVRKEKYGDIDVKKVEERKARFGTK